MSVKRACSGWNEIVFEFLRLADIPNHLVSDRDVASHVCSETENYARSASQSTVGKSPPITLAFFHQVQQVGCEKVARQTACPTHTVLRVGQSIFNNGPAGQK